MSASSSSPAEVRPRCGHFGVCGGCALQHLPYEAQVAAKTAKVSEVLSFLKEPVALQSHPAPEPWHYRNKMEFSFGDVYPPAPGNAWLKLGLKAKGRWWDILDLQECFLPSPETPALLRAVRRWAQERGVPPYNNKRHVGVLRHLVLRECANAPERMVTLVTAPGEIPEASFVEAVLSVYPASTILRGINGKVSDTAVSDGLKVLLGPGHVTEILRVRGLELKFRISPHSFFQTNTRATQALYGLLADWTAELGAETVLDLYCGGGGITLSVAGSCKKAVGVESNPSAVADAKANATLNGIANAEFYSGQVEVLLPSLLALGAKTVIVDPPRAGLLPKTMEALMAGRPRNLLYVSCNPVSLGRDLAALSGSYRVERAEVFDLFPHTEHVETAVMLQRN
jgi:23S rRNA (uracil1939-C5)-methyltransferase